METSIIIFFITLSLALALPALFTIFFIIMFIYVSISASIQKIFKIGVYKHNRRREK